MKKILIIAALLISANCEAQKLNLLPVQDTLTDSVWVPITQKIGSNYFTYKVKLGKLAAWVNLSVIGQNISNHSLECHGNFLQEWHGNDLWFDSAIVQLSQTNQIFFQMRRNTIFDVENRSGTGIFTVNESGNYTQIMHLSGYATLPGTLVASPGAGAGTSPTVTVTGDDLGGYITVVTGTSPTAGATVVSVVFNNVYSVAPHCIVLTPASGSTAQLSGIAQVWVDQPGISTTSFNLNVGLTALTGSTTYRWYYFVKQ